MTACVTTCRDLALIGAAVVIVGGSIVTGFAGFNIILHGIAKIITSW